ncbi:MAG: hypothetical protein KGJ86_08495, partial [Chloroflexota bacterium]|nr:hypothetical protein [Chloroflexota bacterium]
AAPPTAPAAPRALAVAFARPRAYLLALAGAAAMLLLLLWSGELLRRYPYGWEFHAAPEQFASILLVAVLFGLLLPLQAAAIAKARGAAGAVGGAAGTVFGLLSVSCCAPFIVPAVLSFIGFSGTSLLAFNGAVRQWTLQLTLLSVVLLLVSIALVSRTLAAACRIPARGPG